MSEEDKNLKQYEESYCNERKSDIKKTFFRREYYKR